MPTPLNDPAQTALIQQQVTAAIIDASAQLDQRALDNFGQYLHPECRLYRPTSADPLEGVSAITEAYGQTPSNRLNRHVLSNINITVESAQRAAATTYVTLFSTDYAEAAAETFGAPVSRCLVGEFHDVWVQTADSGWQLLERRADFVLQFPVAEARA